MPALRIFDCELVQVELLLQVREFTRSRVLQRDPDEAFGPRHVRADVVDFYIGQLPTVLIRSAIDQHRIHLGGYAHTGQQRRAAPGGAMLQVFYAIGIA
jgi:hypothetical protein